jgi:hypothetical protein
LPLINIPIFAFSGAFIGNYGASAVLTPITDLRTNGAKIKEDFPTDYVEVLGNRIQNGNHTVDVTLSFLSDSTLVTSIVLGKSINASTEYVAPGEQQYSLLLVDSQGIDSYYFPRLSAIKTKAVEYSKSKPVTTEVVLRAEARNPNTVLGYQAPISTLIPIMSSVSPF